MGTWAAGSKSRAESMQRQQSNVGNFVFQHQPQHQQHTAQDSEPDTAEPGAKVTAARRATARLSRWEAGSSDVSARVCTCGDW